MDVTGGCYCGAVRYRATGEVQAKGMCFCRECQHIAGGGPSVIMAMPAEGFAYTTGAPSQFSRSDLATPGTREFCATCGTHLLTRSPRAPGRVLIKVGSLDDPGVYGMPGAVVYVSEMQTYHTYPQGVMAFDKFPPAPEAK